MVVRMTRRELIKGLSLAPVALLAAPLVSKAVARPRAGSREWWKTLSTERVHIGIFIHDEHPRRNIQRIVNIEAGRIASK